MADMILGVGDLGANQDPEKDVKTFALGSCVAVCLLDPKTRTVGMAHIALPESSVNEEKSKTKPGYFADTGVQALLNEMSRYGCDPRGKGMICKICGGANVMDPKGLFNIGKRNVLAVKKILWRLGIAVVAEDVGGSYSRTVTIISKKGAIKLTSPGKPDWSL